MSLATDFTNWFSPVTANERKQISQLFEKIGLHPAAYPMVRSAFLLRCLSIDDLVGAFDNAILQIQTQQSAASEDDETLLACIHLLIPYLPTDQQKILGQLRVFSGYFGDTTATGVLMPEYEYEDIEEGQSPIDDLIEVFVSYGLLNKFTLNAAPNVKTILFIIPDIVRSYFDRNFPSVTEDIDLLERFAEAQTVLSQTIIDRIEVDVLQRHFARLLLRDFRSGLNYLRGSEKMEHTYRCARIAEVLGDERLADELRETTVTRAENDKDADMERFLVYIRSTHTLKDFKQVFPTNPETLQERLDKVLITAADKFVDLGILRRLSLSSYEFILSFPQFVEQLTLTPHFGQETDVTQLDAAIDAAKTAIKHVRKYGFTPESALLSFALGRAFVMKRMWVQANTQFENAARFAKSMNDERLLAAAHIELAPVRIYRGFERETHTLNVLLWAYLGFRRSGDFSNCCAATIADDVFTTLMHMRPETTPTRSLKLLEESGLSRNAFRQTADDIIALYQHLQSK